MGKAKLKWQRDFGQEEVAAELNGVVGHPRPREASSQKAQLRSGHPHGTRKDKKLGMSKKMT